MPSCKFIVPKNLDKIAANQDFKVRPSSPLARGLGSPLTRRLLQIQMKINNMVSGNFTNPTTTYYAAPAQIDKASGNIIGVSLPAPSSGSDG